MQSSVNLQCTLASQLSKLLVDVSSPSDYQHQTVHAVARACTPTLSMQQALYQKFPRLLKSFLGGTRSIASSRSSVCTAIRSGCCLLLCIACMLIEQACSREHCGPTNTTVMCATYIPRDMGRCLI